MAGDYLDALEEMWKEEGLFARGIDGQLVRSVEATPEDYDRKVTLTIDDEKISVRKAVRRKDSQGNFLEDADGKTIPRFTTIYDAAQELFVQRQHKANPIPILCHQEHMQPVAVCRVCSVEICRKRGGRDETELVPACHHPVKKGMIVHTIYSPNRTSSERVKTSVRMLTELLAADHLTDLSALKDRRTPNNDFERHILRLRDELGINCDPERLQIASREKPGKDMSSLLIAVDHNACILCERCKRGCSEIKDNRVIGRSGKGYSTQIAFDLNDKMGRSSCVSCGECMVYCPTDALTFRNPIESKWHAELIAQPGYSAVTAEKLLDVEVTDEEEGRIHKLFAALPYKWLQWNATSIVRRKVKKDDVLCRLGAYGTTAFILLKGDYGIWFNDPHAAMHNESSTGIGAVPPGDPDRNRSHKDVILGEMACMTFQRRTATVVARTEGEYLEIRRNVLYELQRNAIAREFLDKIYRRRALEEHLCNVPLFEDLSSQDRDRVREFLTNYERQVTVREEKLTHRVGLIRVDPGQIICRQGETFDHFYMIRIGHVKVAIEDKHGRDRVLTYLRPMDYFGEISALLLTDREKFDVDELMKEGKRMATCSALDDVELVRIPGRGFLQMLEKFEFLRRRFVELGQQRLAENSKTKTSIGGPLRDFLDQGLYNAQKLLVLDLNSCTRCDECVKACADTHDGISRFVREGLRFQDYLVASACRSCTDPYCLVGCPVDAIHREHSLEISIEDHCIGCGQCATNCPYGNINMVGLPEEQPDPETGRMRAVIQQRATTCDLCSSLGINASDSNQQVSCVYACPHGSAHRMSGHKLFDMIKSQHRDK